MSSTPLSEEDEDEAYLSALGGREGPAYPEEDFTDPWLDALLEDMEIELPEDFPTSPPEEQEFHQT